MCPNKKCILKVKEGKVYCKVHDKFLKIVQDWENVKNQITMHHLLYVAYSNGKAGEILIDEEV